MSEAQIRIRRYTSGDVESLYEAARESIDEIFPWLPWCHPGYTRDEAEQWIGSRDELFDGGREYNFGVFDAAGRFLGGCGLNHIHPLHRFANLGYWVRSSATGRGVATAAVRQLAEFAFTETDLVRLEIVCAVGNDASQRVAERSGAIREAVLRDRLRQHDGARDAVMYAILRSEWNRPDC